MKKNCLSNRVADINVYESPVCEVIIVGTQRVICASETEHVGEEDGQW